VEAKEEWLKLDGRKGRFRQGQPVLMLVHPIISIASFVVPRSSFETNRSCSAKLAKIVVA
jgi:hypothetical protein